MLLTTKLLPYLLIIRTYVKLEGFEPSPFIPKTNILPNYTITCKLYIIIILSLLILNKTGDGFEPSLLDYESNELTNYSYLFMILEIMGIEPITSSLQKIYSTI